MAFIVPPIADKYGRKVTLWAASAFMVAGGIIGGFSINTGQLVGSRVLIGIGTSFGFVGGAAMIPEIAHPRLRGRAGAGFFTWYVSITSRPDHDAQYCEQLLHRQYLSGMVDLCNDILP